jgi:alkylhydroperoxidase/carboxymuconolactone decarboxylase family protein YurZ
MIPKPYQQMHRDHPELMIAYEAFASAARDAGPLDNRTLALVKLAISLGAGLEGGAHSHARKALEAGCTPAQLRHVALLCAPTIGFPPMMRARGWVEDVLEKSSPADGSHGAQPQPQSTHHQDSRWQQQQQQQQQQQ